MYEFYFQGHLYRSNISEPYFGIEHEDKAIERALSFLKQDDIVFDIGAQYGTWTLPAAATRKPNMVYAFEPYTPFFNNLKENIDCNDLEIKNRITPVNIGFDKESRNNVPYSSKSVSIYAADARDSKIDVTTLDKYVIENNIERINHIKIDVDGPELHILVGGAETLKRFKPNIAVEEHNYIYPNVSLYIFQYLIYQLQIPYSVESIPIFNIEKSVFPQCRHTLYYL